MPGEEGERRRVSLRGVKQRLKDSAVPVIAMNLDAVAKFAGNILTSKRMGALAETVEVAFGHIDQFEDRFLALAERSRHPALVAVADRRRQARAKYYMGPMLGALEEVAEGVLDNRDYNATVGGRELNQRLIGATLALRSLTSGELGGEDKQDFRTRVVGTIQANAQGEKPTFPRGYELVHDRYLLRQNRAKE